MNDENIHSSLIISFFFDQNDRIFAHIERFFTPGGVVRPFWAHLSCHPHQLASHHPEIAQRKQREHLRRILDQSAVSHLGVDKLTLDHAKRVLDLGADRRFQILESIHNLAQAFVLNRILLAWLHRHVPLNVQILEFIAFLNAGIARITKHILLLTVQQRMGLCDVVLIGRRCGDRVNQAPRVRHEPS